MTMFLEVDGLFKHFGGVQAVEDLSFGVGAGEIVGLIGPNGAGKSTAFNIINGIIKPDRGTVTFDGEDITGLRPDRIAKRGIGRAHQIAQPLLGMTVMENCLVGACFGREDLSVASAEAPVREAAALCGLTGRLGDLASTLTTAGKKRLELARALSAKPRLLLLDEVLAGLNPTETEGMIAVLRQIKARGIAILMVEHVVRVVMSLSDRIVVMHLGRKLAEGAPREVAENPDVIKAYLGDAPDIAALAGAPR